MDSLKLMVPLVLIFLMVSPVTADVTDSKTFTSNGTYNYAYDLSSDESILRISWHVDKDDDSWFRTKVCIEALNEDCRYISTVSAKDGTIDLLVQGKSLVISFEVEIENSNTFTLDLNIEINEKTVLTPIVLASIPLLVIAISIIRAKKQS